MKKIYNSSYYDNFLDINNLKNVIEKYDTPLYIYKSEKIISQYKKIKKAFSSIKKVNIHYACKANNNINILKLLKKEGSNLDTVSIEEIKLGILAGFNPKDIIYTPNGVSENEIIKAKKLGVKINIDNIYTLELFGKIFSSSYPIGIRINPNIFGGGNKKISVGHKNSKFGISYKEISNIKNIISKTKLKIEGIHMHTGSDILNIDTFLKSSDILFKTAKKFDNLKYLDFGSGFKVSYHKNDKETNIYKLGKILGKKFNFFCNEYGRDLDFIIEPGKFIVSQAGIFLVKVNIIKKINSIDFAFVNSGFNHFLRPMFYDAYHNIKNISNPLGKLKIYNIVGYICESDTFGFKRKINEIRKGDILCIKNAGAYCFSMSSNYNSRLKPSEVLLYKKKYFLIRKKESFNDLLKNIIKIKL